MRTFDEMVQGSEADEAEALRELARRLELARALVAKAFPSLAADAAEHAGIVLDMLDRIDEALDGGEEDDDDEDSD